MAVETVIVLPPKEGFGSAAIGAIGLLVHRLACAGAGGLVLGEHAEPAPLPGVPFEQVIPGWGVTRRDRYASGVRRVLRRIRPRLVEVHNRPDLALALAGEGAPVGLILNNDPQAMRRAHTPTERTELLGRLAFVATSSDYLRRRLLEGVTPPARAPWVLHNCTDVPPAVPHRREGLVLFAGRVVRDKGADTFADACALALSQLPGWRAAMIGADGFSASSPETAFVAQVRAAAAAAGIVMHGYREHDDVLDAMTRAAIVVVPSRWNEPFGIVAIEALACGAALICSPRGGLPEVAGDCADYVEPDDPAALARAIVALARDGDRRAALSQAGRVRALLFSADRAAQTLNAHRQPFLSVAAAAP